jgi:hypothetical protein
LEEKVAAPVYKTENTAVGIRHADHIVPSIRKKLALTSLTSDGRSVGIIPSRTQVTEFSFSFIAIMSPVRVIPVSLCSEVSISVDVRICVE